MKLMHAMRRSTTLLIFIVLYYQITWGRQAPPAAPNKAQPNPSQEIQTQKIESPPAHPEQPATLNNVTGSLPAAELKVLLKNVRFSEYRINDLLTDVHPEKWKLPEATLESFNQSLKTLHNQVDALEQWRGQFEQRPDSLYLGFETYSTIDTVLPRLNGVTQSIGEHETAAYAAQFSRAWGQLFDLQQSIGGYVSSLMQSQDQVMVDYASNMAACQQSLSAAMRGKSSRATYTRNSQPIRPQRRSAHPSPAKPRGSEKQGKQENKPGAKKPAAPANPAPKK
ncbi:MAG TPA: hypothetical protein VG028_21285 [Terriglobia bacterium]|nr:hypothetical protein [Terriglobia bacterium]